MAAGCWEGWWKQNGKGLWLCYLWSQQRLWWQKLPWSITDWNQSTVSWSLGWRSIKQSWCGEGHFSKSLACTEEKEDPRLRSGKRQKRFYFEVRKKMRPYKKGVEKFTIHKNQFKYFLSLIQQKLIDPLSCFLKTSFQDKQASNLDRVSTCCK